MLPRHEVPTHLDVEDRVFFGFMTVRHVMVMAIGLFFAAAVVLSPPLPLPGALRYLVAAVIGAATLAVAFIEPDGRKMEDWLLAFARYRTTPRVLVWTPADNDWADEEAAQGVLVLGGRTAAGGGARSMRGDDTAQAGGIRGMQSGDISQFIRQAPGYGRLTGGGS